MSDIFTRQQGQTQTGLTGLERKQKEVAAEKQQQDTSQQQQAENQRKIAAFEADNVKLDDGTYVSNAIFNSLDAEGRSVLKKEGVDAYSKYFTQKQETELAKDNVRLKSGEWIAKETYDSMPGDWQARLIDGTDSWKQFWDSKPYGNAQRFVIGNYNEVYGVTGDPNIGIDIGGNRIYLGDTWPQSVAGYTGKPGEVRTADIVARGEKLVAAKFDIETPEAATIETKAIVAPESASIIGYSPTTNEILVKGEKTGVQQWQSEKGTDFEKLTESQKDEVIETGSYTVDERTLSGYGQDVGAGAFNAGYIDATNKGLGYSLLTNKEVSQKTKNVILSDPNLQGILNTLFPSKDNAGKTLTSLQGFVDKNVQQTANSSAQLITWLSEISGTSNQGLADYLSKNKDVPQDIKDAINNDKNLQGILNTLIPNVDNPTKPLAELQDIIDKNVQSVGELAKAAKSMPVNDTNLQDILKSLSITIDPENPVITAGQLQKIVDRSIQTIADNSAKLVPWLANISKTNNSGALGNYLLVNKDVPQGIKDAVSSDKNLQGILNTLFPDVTGKNNDVYAALTPLKALQSLTDQQVMQIAADPLSLIPFTWVANISKMDTPEIIANGAIDLVFTVAILRGIKLNKAEISAGLKEISTLMKSEQGFVSLSPQIVRESYDRLLRANKIVQTLDTRSSGIPDRLASEFIKQRVYNPSLTPEQFMKTRSVFDVLNRPAPLPSKSVVPPPVPTRRSSPNITSSIDAAIARQKKEALQNTILLRAQTIAKANAQSKALSASQKLATSENEMAAAVSPIIEKSLSEGVITRTINANPESFIRAYQAATPQVQQAVRSNLDPATLKALLAKSATQLKTATSTQVKVLEALQTITSNAALVATKTQLQGKTLAQTKTQTEAYAKAQTEALPDTEVKTMVKPLIDTMVKTATETKIQTKTKPQTKVAVKVKVGTKTRTKTTPKPEMKKPQPPKKPTKGKKPPPPFIIKMPDGEEKELTEKEIKGSPAWKQGFMYKMWLPPYNDNSMINTKEPIPGVEYHTDAGSAIRSAVILDGELKRRLRYNMGIQDVYIEPGKSKRKPKMRFMLDKNQETSGSGIVTRRK